jgi:biotin operon repressor
MSEGWVKIHRRLLNWQWYTDNNTKVVYLHLLLKATHRNLIWRNLELKPGQLITSTRKIAAELEISHQSVRTCLRHLVKSGEISVKPNKHYSLITINTWDKYQKIPDTEEMELMEEEEKLRPNYYPDLIPYESDLPESLDEVCEFFIKNKLKIDPVAFVNKYDENLWTDSHGNPIENWKALAIAINKSKDTNIL